MTRTRTRVLTTATATLGLALSAAAAAPAGAEEWDNWLDDVEVTSTAYSTLVGGDYYYQVQNFQAVAPAELFGVPDQINSDIGAQPVELTYHWGDGSPDSVIRSDTDPTTTFDGSFSCWSDWWLDESTDPPTYVAQDDFGLGCSSGYGHIYQQQGIFGLYLTGTQTQSNGTVAAAQSGVFPQLVVDLAKGGTLTGKGTVYAPAGGGGMYDTDFAGGVATFQVTAKRRDGQAATSVTLTVSVPSMTPDFPADNPPTGMSFSAKAGLAPMYVAKTKTGGEVFLRLVEGQVTNSNGSAGTARATIHTIVAKGMPTVIRIQLQNASAGFTYLDTGYQPVDYYSLDEAHDLLVSGSVKVG